MNKIIIPSILVAVLMIAGAFAIMPVEKASTVHTTIATNVNQQFRGISYTVEGGNADIVLIPAGVLTAADAVVTNIGSAGTCTLEDQTGAVIGAAVGSGVTNTIDVDGDADFADGDALRVDASAGATCEITVFVQDL